MKRLYILPSGFTPLEVCGIRWILRTEPYLKVVVVSGPSDNLPQKPEGIAVTLQAYGRNVTVDRESSLRFRNIHHLEIAPDMISRNSLIDALSPFAEEEIREQNQLTQREKDVLRLIAKGLANKEVADRLCISINTAITHRKNITTKLGIKSSAGLSLYAYLHGVISDSDYRPE